MQNIEPHFSWRDEYIASEDRRSPFYRREYSEFEYTNSIYNYCIHPQWDDFGSSTLYVKILYTDYKTGFTVIEMIGEWNDAINNDVALFKREIIDKQIELGVNKFILIGENVLNFHGSDDCYYEDWFRELNGNVNGTGEGWISMINFRSHVLVEMKQYNVDAYVKLGEEWNDINWRTYKPQDMLAVIENRFDKELPSHHASDSAV
ncbi:MAG: hypothetical protein IIA45_00190 [Bacteroidetes bacterium]|nr:hypothetical protein [Bacteroidota bacterium]